MDRMRLTDQEAIITPNKCALSLSQLLEVIHTGAALAGRRRPTRDRLFFAAQLLNEKIK